MADNQELTEKELDFAIEYMRPMELWVSEMLQILKNNDIETKKQLTTTQQALDRAVEALKDLHDDINGRKEDGQAFNPGTLFALGRARSVLASIKE